MGTASSRAQGDRRQRDSDESQSAVDEFLDLCDRLGLLVKDEAFDEFTPAKNKWVNGWNVGVPSRFGYAEDFAAWSVTDVEDMVARDRNHPAILMWSIGNEIDYPNDPFSHPALGSSYRPTNPPRREPRLARPPAHRRRQGARPDATRDDGPRKRRDVRCSRPRPALLDIVGYNYQESRYADRPREYPRASSSAARRVTVRQLDGRARQPVRRRPVPVDRDRLPRRSASVSESREWRRPSSPETMVKVNTGCRSAGIGCIECKGWAADALVSILNPMQERRKKYEENPRLAWDILEEGSDTSPQGGQPTMEEVRDAMHMSLAYEARESK